MLNFENFEKIKFRDILLTGTVPAKPGRMVGLPMLNV